MKKNFNKNSLFLIVLAVLSFISFFSCSSAKNLETSKISPVYVTNTKKYMLLPPSDMSKSVDSLQLLNATFGKQSFSVLAYIQADSNGISMDLLNDFGTDMGTLTYDGIEVVLDSAMFPSNLKAEYVIADYQFALYDFESVYGRLNELGLSFTESTDKNGNTTRILSNGNKVIEEIKIENGQIKITNKLRGYEYVLTESEF